MTLRDAALIASVLVACGAPGAGGAREPEPPTAEQGSAEQARQVDDASRQDAEPHDDGETPAAPDPCAAIEACRALRAAIEADDVGLLDGHLAERLYVDDDVYENAAALREASARAGGVRALLGLLEGPVHATVTLDCSRCVAVRYELRLSVGERAVDVRTRGAARLLRIDRR